MSRAPGWRLEPLLRRWQAEVDRAAAALAADLAEEAAAGAALQAALDRAGAARQAAEQAAPAGVAGGRPGWLDGRALAARQAWAAHLREAAARLDEQAGAAAAACAEAVACAGLAREDHLRAVAARDGLARLRQAWLEGRARRRARAAEAEADDRPRPPPGPGDGPGAPEGAGEEA